jgi:single-strand DNA-binding protein
MKSVNKVILLGNVGQPPEVKQGSGTLRATISIATNEKVKRGDKWEDHVEWHRIVLFCRLAEIARDYLRKGSKVFIEGKLRTFHWVDDAQVTRYSTNIVATELTLLDSHDSRQPQPPEESYSEAF